MIKDDIFAVKEGWEYETFEFDKRVVNVFDDMVSRSVPGYTTIQLLAADIALQFSKGNYIYDLGCSTGNTISSILRRAKKPVKIVGIDNSEEMVNQCKENFCGKEYEYGHDITLEYGDITKDNIFRHSPVDVVILNLVLQFVRPSRRKEVIENIFKSIAPGGCLILVEKTINSDKLINEFYIKYYHSYKKEMGYSDMEISNKREALENKLIPYYAEENIELLRSVGFSRVSSFFQWMNFSGFLAIKD